MKDFTFAKFLISCAHEHLNFDSEPSLRESKKANSQQVAFLMRYLRPLHPILSRSSLLSRGGSSEPSSGTNIVPETLATYAERKEELRLLISFDDCKWLCDTFWQHFFKVVAPVAERRI